MKKWIIIAGLLSITQSPLSAQEVLDGMAAVVGEDVILLSDVTAASQSYAMQMGVDPSTDTTAFNQLKKDILQNLINEKVLLAKAKEDTITVSSQHVDGQLEERIQDFIRRAGSVERLESYFGLPLSKIRRNMRQDLEKRLIIQTLQQQKLREIKISRREVEDFYNTMKDSLPDRKALVKLRHILIPIGPGQAAKAEAETKMKTIEAKLQAGEDFESLAKTYSEDPGTASKGGNLGWIDKGTLYPAFEAVAYQLEPGQVSKPVETPVGLHLIQLLEKTGEKAKLRHILIRMQTGSSDDASAVEKAVQIRDSLLTGADFTVMAKRYSEDASTKETGGELGWLPLDELQIEAFKKAVDTLAVNAISMPFKTQFGYHLVQLEGRKAGGKLSLEDDWEEIRSMSLNWKQQHMINAWVEELKKKMYVEVKPGLL
jgi:peptidyl-prolyl cis-trans isomerase SurA